MSPSNGLGDAFFSSGEVKQKIRNTQSCVSITHPNFFAGMHRVKDEKEIFPRKMVRFHCLRYGKYFSLKEKCFRCGYMISFTQRVE